MSDKKNQKANQFGIGNKSEITINQSIEKGQIVLTEETYKQNLENAAKAKQLELQSAQQDEDKVVIQKEIDAINITLADLPKSLKNALDRIDKLEAIIAHKEQKTKVDILTDALNALRCGEVAEQENRLDDAMAHYALAAKLNPTFNTLTIALNAASKIYNYSSALSYALEAAKAAIKEYGEGSKEYANSLANLGVMYSNHGEYKKAEQFHEQALNIYKNLLGDRNFYVANALNNLASAYQDQLALPKATTLYQEALEIRQEVLGKEHPDTASSLYNLGIIYSMQFEHKKAESFFNESLIINKKVLGENHPATATSLRGLASVYQEQERFTESESYYMKALEIYRKEPANNRLTIAYCLNNLAWLYLSIGRHYESIPLYEECIKIFESIYGPNHRSTAMPKRSLEMIQKHIAKKDNPPKPPK